MVIVAVDRLDSKSRYPKLDSINFSSGSQTKSWRSISTMLLTSFRVVALRLVTVAQRMASELESVGRSKGVPYRV